MRTLRAARTGCCRRHRQERARLCRGLLGRPEQVGVHCMGRHPRGWGGSQRPSSPRCASASWKSSTWWGAGRRPVAWRRIGRAEHALALWLACSAGTASAADSGAGQGAAAAPLKVGAGARGGHAHAPGRADGLLLPVHPRLEHARHQRGLLGWLQRVGVHCGRGVGGGRANSGERPHSADLGGATPMMPSEAEPMLVQQLGSRHAIPGRHARRERRSCPLLFSAATSIGKQESLSSDSLVGDGTVVGLTGAHFGTFGGVHRRLGAARA